MRRPGRVRAGMGFVLGIILMVSFCGIIFHAIDLQTVDSFYPRLKDAYWIEPRYIEGLPRVGIASLEDLVQKTKDKTERDELALRLLIPRDELIGWVEKAQLCLLRGLGIRNLPLLERLGITSVTDLAGKNPERLHIRLMQAFPRGAVPSLAKIRIWVREARKSIPKA